MNIFEHINVPIYLIYNVTSNYLKLGTFGVSMLLNIDYVLDSDSILLVYLIDSVT